MGRAAEKTARRNPPRRAIAFTSVELIQEFRDVLAREKFAATIARFGETPQSLAESYTGVAIVIDPAPLSQLGTLRDPKDALVLACAVGAQADAIVSGDIDLGVLKSFVGIPILTPAQCLERIGA